MKARELYEYIKADAIVDIAKQRGRFAKVRNALKQQKEELLNCYLSDEGYNPKNASMVFFVTFIAVMCADNSITVDDFLAMSSIEKGMEEKTFSQFFNDMKKVSEQINCRQSVINHLLKK